MDNAPLAGAEDGRAPSERSPGGQAALRRSEDHGSLAEFELWLCTQAKNEDLEAVIQVCLVSGHHPARLAQCAEELGRLQERAFYARDVMDPLTPVKEKYGERSWYCVSVVEKPVDRGCVVHAIAAASHSPAVQALRNHTREEVHRVLKFR